MMLSERVLRLTILFAYGFSLLNMWWTGAMYRFVGAGLAPLELAGGVLVWLIAAGTVFSEGDGAASDRTPGRNPGGIWKRVGDGLADGDRAQTQEETAGAMWLRGILYALFALPPAIYLLTMYAGW
ncbi:MAG: hypothetical protein ACYCVB_01155 [Bacilli bacterium]